MMGKLLEYNRLSGKVGLKWEDVVYSIQIYHNNWMGLQHTPLHRPILLGTFLSNQSLGSNFFRDLALAEFTWAYAQYFPLSKSAYSRCPSDILKVSQTSSNSVISHYMSLYAIIYTFPSDTQDSSITISHIKP